LKQIIDETDLSSEQSNIKGDSIISAETRKKIGTNIVGTSNTEDFSNHSGQLDDGRRQSYFAEQKLDILIVDDSGLSRKMLCRLLRTTGCTFDEAEDGLIAVDKVKTKMSVFPNESEKDVFDVILMDYVMPNMDGPTATKAIRELGYTAPIFGKYCIKYVYMHY
jgi:PleD family two-component response regulator